MTIETIKFSEFLNGGDLANDDTTVGLRASTNTKFNNPWTFLPPGTTGDRPVPAASMYYRMRLNTTLEFYEYYDPTTATWVEFSGSGTGTVNPGNTNDLAFYPASGTAVSPINAAANSVLVTNGSSVPSLSTTFPTGLTLPGATITSSTASLTSGQVAAAPSAGTDITNKTYVDGLFNSGVRSITGTTNQVIASSPTGNVTLSLPQDIALGSTPTFSALKLTSNSALLDTNGNVIIGYKPQAASVNYLNINNNVTGQGPGMEAMGADPTITLTFRTKSTGQLGFYSEDTSAPVQFFTGTGNQHFTYFNFANTSAVRTVTFQDATGTVAFLTDIPAVSPAALTKTDDTNVTLTLGGTPTTALLQATSLTLGWTGTLSGTRGGTGVNNGASTITLGGNLTTSGAFATTFTMTGATNVTFPTSGTLLTSAGAVTSITGTANQVVASASTGAVTLSLPQSINTTAAVQFNSVRFNTANCWLDSNGAVMGQFNAAASAVNYLALFNAATTASPSIQVGGTDTDIGFKVATKNAGAFTIATAALTQPLIITSGTSSQHSTTFAFSNTAASRTVTFPDSSFTVASNASSTFTPVIAFGGGSTGITYTTQTGTYSQVGSVVTFHIEIVLSSKGSSTGVSTLTGMPVALRAGSAKAVFFITFEGVTYTGTVGASMAASGTTLTFYSIASAGTSATIADTAWTNTSKVYITGSYCV